MRFLINSLRHSRVLRGVGANIYVQVTQIISQIMLVPIMASHWGLKTYGVWLLLFSVPGYLSLTDFGIGRAATAAMVSYVARGERDNAIGTFKAARAVTLMTNGSGLLIVVLLAFIVFHDQLNQNSAIVHADVALVLSILALYGAITLQNGITAALYTACGAYALSGYAVGTMFVVETLSATVIVVTGGSIAMVAVSYLAIRLAGTLLLAFGAQRVAPWLHVDHPVVWRGHVKRLLRPATALVFLTVAQALSIQGTVAVVGFVCGAAVVPFFTTVRTMSRTAMQAILIVNHAIMPSFNVAMATENRSKVRELMTMSIVVTLICSTFILVPSVFLGRWFIELWTNGVVRPGIAILVVMGLSAFANTLWTPISNLIMAINLQERFAYAYLGASLFGLVICIPLSKAFAATGAALSLLVVDVFMLVWIVPLARVIGVLDLRDLRHDIPRVWRRLTVVEQGT